MKKTLQFIAAGAEVLRYHTVTTLIRETVGHHSHGVACLVLILKPDAARHLLTAALLHDLSEHQTGDIPSPAKREYGIGDQVDKLERRLMLEAGIEFPVLLPEEQRILKLADIAHGAMYCAREISLGNSRMRIVYDRYLSYAKPLLQTGRERELFAVIEEIANESE